MYMWIFVKKAITNEWMPIENWEISMITSKVIVCDFKPRIGSFGISLSLPNPSSLPQKMSESILHSSSEFFQNEPKHPSTHGVGDPWVPIPHPLRGARCSGQGGFSNQAAIQLEKDSSIKFSHVFLWNHLSYIHPCHFFHVSQLHWLPTNQRHGVLEIQVAAIRFTFEGDGAHLSDRW